MEINVWFFVKIAFMVALAVYVVFAGVIVRQVGLMTKTLKVGFEFPIKTVAWGHLLFAVGALILATMIL